MAFSLGPNRSGGIRSIRIRSIHWSKNTRSLLEICTTSRLPFLKTVYLQVPANRTAEVHEALERVFAARRSATE